jgi:hypothetical protein
MPVARGRVAGSVYGAHLQCAGTGCKRHAGSKLGAGRCRCVDPGRAVGADLNRLARAKIPGVGAVDRLRRSARDEVGIRAAGIGAQRRDRCNRRRWGDVDDNCLSGERGLCGIIDTCHRQGSGR